MSEQKSEFVISTSVRAILSTAPFTGGLASMWADWDSRRRQLRVDAILKDMQARLIELEDRFNPDALRDSELHLLEIGLEYASREHREWKRAFFANLLASNWIELDQSFEDREHSLRALDEITPLELSILKYLDKPDSDSEISPTNLAELLRPSEADDSWRSSYFLPAMTRLAIDFGFIQRKGTKEGRLMVGLNPDGLAFHCVLSLHGRGKRFLNCISDDSDSQRWSPDIEDLTNIG
ncbi:MAG: hypothetical protein AAGI54_13205 [Planctomycetota bacterium]